MKRLVLSALLASLGTGASAQNPYLSGFTTLGRTAYDAPLAAMGGAGAFLPDDAPVAALSHPARLSTALTRPGTRFSLSGAPDAYDFVFVREQLGFEIDQSVGVLAASTVVPFSAPFVLAVAAGTNAQSFEDGGEITDRSVALSAATRVGGSQAYLDLGVTGRLTRASYLFPLAVSEDLSLNPYDESSLRMGADAGLTGTFAVARPQAGKGGVRPSLSLSAGYAQRAIGRDFRFGDEVVVAGQSLGATEIQQPRSATVGYAVQAGLSRPVGGQPLALISVDLAVEAEADLNGRDGSDGIDAGNENAALVGSLRFRDVLLGTSSDADVQGRRGLRLTLGDALRVSVGRASTESRFPDVFEAGVYTSWGVGVDVAGALRTIGALQSNHSLVALGRRYDLALDVAQGGFETDQGTVIRFGIASLTAGVRFGAR